MTHPSQPTPLRALGWLVLFAGLTFGASLGFQWLYIRYLAFTDSSLSADQRIDLFFDWVTSSQGLGTLYLIQVAVVLPLLLMAAHFPQQSWRHTLALYPVRLGVIGKWLLAWVATMAVVGFVLYQMGASEELFMEQVLSNPHWLMLLSASVLAPILEELVFRGYLWKAFRPTRMGFIGTLLVTSTAFAMMHGLQYSEFGIAQVFCLALVMGVAREYTGSVVTPIVIHTFQNTLASVLILAQ